MGRSSSAFAIGIYCTTFGLAIAGTACLGDDWSGHHSESDRRPVYQRRAFEWTPGHGGWHGRDFSRGPVRASRHVEAGWFQRPYPYHLDYYRMRYGGSYAPYFGNLYGPPQVVTAPPYYGPYYGGYGAPNGGGFYDPYGNGMTPGHGVPGAVEGPVAPPGE